jgi:diacylglycerol O-acyltransferase-1
MIEILAVKGFFKDELLILLMNISVATLNLMVPCIWVWYSRSHPLGCMIYLFNSVILWMKLISYAHANRDLRNVLKAKKNEERLNTGGMEDNNAKPYALNLFNESKNLEAPYLQYPMNITPKNLGYFLLAPTLTYQLNFPRSPTIRIRYVTTVLLRLIVVLLLIVFSFEQYIKPALATSISPIRDSNLIGLLEGLLVLSIPNTYIWLLGFYFYFHLYLNLFAELTRFGDRVFYRDWWNARTIETYWRNWNIPVHCWMLRYIYIYIYIYM